MNDYSEIWRGRDDASEQGDTRRLFQIVQQEVSACTGGDPVLLGFACDAGVRRNKGRPGSRGGPRAIRAMLAGLPAHTLNVLWDAGDVICEGDALESAQAALGERVATILGLGGRPVVLGGGHEMAWGSFQGLSQYLESRSEEINGERKPLLIVNMDAHFDLRTSRPGSSGTPFDQILEACRTQGRPVTYACFGISRLGNTSGLFAHADSLGAFYIEDVDMQERSLDQRLADLALLLAQAEDVYLTIDLDVLPAAVAPGVSAPAAYGVPLSVVEAFVDKIHSSSKLRLADIAEMNPDLDIDHHTARVAARLVWRLLMP
ncbi:formimidoylglutamase [Allopusillimonas ginsengisoli]|uniref:formimidoylglutamase n=1 Tax=Allopusillimonas ginsengisoli TaxID=453575 RepID=UPI0010C19C20|nr:formimidoylglutamase [Allopusillimonas ginsengisoli]